MQLTLTFDIGNSNPHVGWFVDDELKRVTKLAEVTEQTVDAVGAHKISAITSKVGSDFGHGWLNPTEVINWRNLKNFLGMPFKYAGTLGADRLVQIHFLHKSRPEIQVLIDAGTFTTVDLIAKNGHLGGIIIPGFETYLDVFKLRGAKLPRLSSDQINLDKSPSLLALNTYDAIAEGYKLLLSKINNEIQQLDMHNVILTGGHGERLKSLFPNAVVEPHLIHLALFHALKSARELGIP